MTYLPIPLGGICLLLFVIERLLIGPPPDPAARTVTQRRNEPAMEVFIVLGTMFFGFAIGVPIAYSLALAALAGAYGSASRSKR